MNKDMIYFGIDISKDVFDVMDSNSNYFRDPFATLLTTILLLGRRVYCGQAH